MSHFTGISECGVYDDGVMVKWSVSAIFIVRSAVNSMSIGQGSTNLGVDVGSFTDNDSNNDAGGPMLPSGQPHNPSRRHFSRAALAGSAVLLSLGNRAAWGGGSQTIGCMSVTTLNSFNPTTGMFISAPAGRPEHNSQMAAEIHRVSNPPNFLGTDGTYSTCQDPTSIDGVCLVKGNCRSR